MFFPKPNVVCILGPDWNGVSSFTRQIQLLGTKERKTSVLNPNIFWLPMAFKLNNPKSMRPKQDLRRACSAHPVHGSLPGKEHVRWPNYDIIQYIQNLSFESPHSKNFNTYELHVKHYCSAQMLCRKCPATASEELLLLDRNQPLVCHSHQSWHAWSPAQVFHSSNAVRKQQRRLTSGDKQPGPLDQLAQSDGLGIRWIAYNHNRRCRC